MNLIQLLWTLKRHALYMRPFGYLWDPTPFEDVLQDVLEDVFGLPPRPHIDGHDGGGPKKQGGGWGAQNWDEECYLEILGGERGRHHYKLLFSNCLVFGILGFFIPRLSLGMKNKNLILLFLLGFLVFE